MRCISTFKPSATSQVKSCKLNCYYSQCVYIIYIVSCICITPVSNGRNLWFNGNLLWDGHWSRAWLQETRNRTEVQSERTRLRAGTPMKQDSDGKAPGELSTVPHSDKISRSHGPRTHADRAHVGSVEPGLRNGWLKS